MSLSGELFRAIIIDPDCNSRNRLKNVTTSVSTFKKVTPLHSLREAKQKVTDGEKLEVAFISCAFSQEEIASFVTEAKGRPEGEDCAYVLVMKTKDQESSIVAASVLLGIDGFLFEPYSADGLVEITRLANRIKGERGAAREAAGLKVLLRSILPRLDAISSLKSMSADTERHMKKLREECAAIASFSAEKLTVYGKIAAETFSEAKLPMARAYGGVSSRVKKKMQAKSVADLAAIPALKPSGLTPDADDLRASE